MKSIVLLLVLTATISAVAQSPTSLIDPFTARYNVYFKGLSVGNGEISLSHNEPNGYRMHLTAQPSGLATLITNIEIQEIATGQFDNGGPRPDRYRYRQTGSERDSDVDFDWPSRRAEVVYEGERITLDLPPDTLDPLSLYLQVIFDLRRGQPGERYRLINRGKIRDYDVIAQGKDTIDTPLGELETLRFERQRQGSSRSARFWFAPALGYIPVQIVQYRYGEENLRLTLQSFDANPEALLDRQPLALDHNPAQHDSVDLGVSVDRFQRVGP